MATLMMTTLCHRESFTSGKEQCMLRVHVCVYEWVSGWGFPAPPSLSLSAFSAHLPFAEKHARGSTVPACACVNRIQQRSGRKTLTTVQGIHPDYDQKKIVKVLKKEFACNGNITTHKEYGEVIQLQVRCPFHFVTCLKIHMVPACLCLYMCVYVYSVVDKDEQTSICPHHVSCPTSHAQPLASTG